MFEVGYSEILVIAIVLIVVVGPKDLPKMLRAFGKATTKFRQMSGDFRKQFDDALKEAELDEVRKTISDVRKLDPRQQVRDVFNPLRDVGNSLKADLNKAVQAPTTPTVEKPIVVGASAIVYPSPKVAPKTKAASKAGPINVAAAKPVAVKPVSVKTVAAKAAPAKALSKGKKNQ